MASSSSSKEPASSSAPAGDGSEEPCVVCLDAIKNEATVNGCNHKFCFDCIKSWSNITNSCPVCKKNFTRIKTKQPETSRSKKKEKEVRVRKRVQNVRYEDTGLMDTTDPVNDYFENDVMDMYGGFLDVIMGQVISGINAAARSARGPRSGSRLPTRRRTNVQAREVVDVDSEFGVYPLSPSSSSARRGGEATLRRGPIAWNSDESIFGSTVRQIQDRIEMERRPRGSSLFRPGNRTAAGGGGTGGNRNSLSSSSSARVEGGAQNVIVLSDSEEDIDAPTSSTYAPRRRSSTRATAQSRRRSSRLNTHGDGDGNESNPLVDSDSNDLHESLPSSSTQPLHNISARTNPPRGERSTNSRRRVVIELSDSEDDSDFKPGDNEDDDDDVIVDGTESSVASVESDDIDGFVDSDEDRSVIRNVLEDRYRTALMLQAAEADDDEDDSTFHGSVASSHSSAMNIGSESDYTDEVPSDTDNEEGKRPEEQSQNSRRAPSREEMNWYLHEEWHDREIERRNRRMLNFISDRPNDWPMDSEEDSDFVPCDDDEHDDDYDYDIADTDESVTDNLDGSLSSTRRNNHCTSSATSSSSQRRSKGNNKAKTKKAKKTSKHDNKSSTGRRSRSCVDDSAGGAGRARGSHSKSMKSIQSSRRNGETDMRTRALRAVSGIAHLPSAHPTLSTSTSSSAAGRSAGSSSSSSSNPNASFSNPTASGQKQDDGEKKVCEDIASQQSNGNQSDLAQRLRASRAGKQIANSNDRGIKDVEAAAESCELVTTSQSSSSSSSSQPSPAPVESVERSPSKRSDKTIAKCDVTDDDNATIETRLGKRVRK